MFSGITDFLSFLTWLGVFPISKNMLRARVAAFSSKIHIWRSHLPIKGAHPVLLKLESSVLQFSYCFVAPTTLKLKLSGF